VQVTTVNGLTGFSQRDVNKKHTIAPHGTVPLQIAAKVQRRGAYRVQAQLLAPNGTPLGAAVPLTVHSTALGRIGIVITVVAGAVLAFALLVRVTRRVRRRRRQKAKALDQAEPATVP
jgi:hypothetical protein